MDDKRLEEVAEALLSLYPLYFRKFLYGADVSASLVARYKILGITAMGGSLPVSELARRLAISRPYMTKLTEGMTVEGLIERQYDEKDRRIVRIQITGAGRTYLRKTRAHHKKRIRHLISSLGDEDLVRLSETLPVLNRILEKLS